jgi:CubicO group peptidase (beta-lactamase class C family)
VEQPPHIEGSVSRGFEAVRAAFVENFTRRGELGGACCVYRHGQKVVDLWGGVRDATSGEPWRQDTMVVVHSASEGLAAMTLALAHSRGWLDFDERVATYWPEFAQAGKERVTVRQLLAHQAGLYAFDDRVDRDVVWSSCGASIPATSLCAPRSSVRARMALVQPKEAPCIDTAL